MVKFQPSTLAMWVRFPLPAPELAITSSLLNFSLVDKNAFKRVTQSAFEAFLCALAASD